MHSVCRAHQGVEWTREEPKGLDANLRHLVNVSARPNPESFAPDTLRLAYGAWSAPKPRKPTPTEAGALGGFAVGLALAPTKTQALYGDIAVRTAEAWRKRVMSRKKIPVYARVPRALVAAAAATFVVDYAIAYPDHGARGAVRETTIVRAAERAAAAARARADGVVARVQSLRARLSPGS